MIYQVTNIDMMCAKNDLKYAVIVLPVFTANNAKMLLNTWPFKCLIF